MRVIVAGASGAIGRPLVEQLLARGHEVIGVSRRPVEGPGWSGAIVADVLDHDALLAAARGVRADAVVHELTATRGVPLRPRDLDATNRLRTVGTSHLLRLAAAVGATRMVTRSFLGGYGFVPRGPAPIAEGAPFAVPGTTAPGLRPIIEALKAAERLTRATPGIEGVVLRYGLLYGSGSTDRLAALLHRRALPVPRTGGGVHSYVAVTDAAAAAVAALERGRPGRSYNVCDDDATGWNDFFDAAARAVGAPAPTRVPDAFFRAAPYLDALRRSSIPMANTRAKEELGWSPSASSTAEGLLRSALSLR
ncbi:NAD-dependent epimerase/dehydratase family protein [Amnibacterium kyonggiense]